MATDDAPLHAKDTCSGSENAWQAISPRYGTVLRLIMLFYTAGLLGTGVFLATIVEESQRPLFIAGAVTVASTLLLLAMLWIPRRVRRIEYLARPDDVHMRSGYLWRKTVSVAVNRIQHIEVLQGPLERFYGLSQLVIYTAGGGRSDLRIPGLPHAEAHRLKAHLTRQIVQEETNAEP